MDNEKLGNILTRIGIGGLIVSVLWWLIFYSRVNLALRGSASDMAQTLQCLVFSSGPCGFIKGIASATGEFAYEPLLFWISAGFVAAGLLISHSSTAGTSNNLSNSGGIGENSNSNQTALHDFNKWNSLVEVDPEIAGAVAKLQPYGRVAVSELAQKFLTLNDKQYLNAIVAQISKKYDALPEGERLDELGRNVGLIWRAPWGLIAEMKDLTALVVSSNGVEILPSLQEFHRKYPLHSDMWENVTDVEERRDFFREAALYLQ